MGPRWKEVILKVMHELAHPVRGKDVYDYLLAQDHTKWSSSFEYRGRISSTLALMAKTGIIKVVPNSKMSTLGVKYILHEEGIQPPEHSFDTSFYITLQPLNVDFKKFKDFCKHFGCVVRVVKGDWQVETDDPINFYWLGANTVFRYESNLAISSGAELFK